MKVYLLKFNKATNMDYIGFVIVAENEEKAEKLMRDKYSSFSSNWDTGYIISEVCLDKEHIVLDSYFGE